MNLRVTPFVPSDYVRILEAAEIDTPWIADRLAHGRAYATGGSAYTIWAGADIACALGLVVPWPGRATGWAVWGPLGYRHALAVHRLTVRYLRRLIVWHRLRCIEAEVLQGHGGAERWLDHLGFQPEGEPLFFAGPRGETMRRFVWYHPRARTLPPLWPAAEETPMRFERVTP